jgi:triosephosphate isomerase
MRKKIAAANWKMNLTLEEGKSLLSAILAEDISLNTSQLAIFAVPFPYLLPMKDLVKKDQFFIAAQNCSEHTGGAYTGDTSVAMLKSCGIGYVVIGHSERRQYHHESNAQLAKKVDLLLTENMTPVFCCGEPLDIREAGSEKEYVETQLKESLFHLPASSISKCIIAYEPIWAIGTGKTASTAQAQEMHAHIREVISSTYDASTADGISVLYGGSVKGSNAAELFSQPDVDGGLVGGASLQAAEFSTIIRSLP